MPRPLTRLAPPLLLLAWALGLAAYAWDRGPDPWIDFGRELYVPWRLTEGDTLHRDVAWFNGPLSVVWNALWMRVAGVSFDTLQVVNLGIALVIGALLYHLLCAATGRLAAAVGTAVFFPVFAFAQPAAIGNYTYLAPYSHCLVHGFALGLLALAALEQARRERSAVWCALAGLALGLTFLTKAEVFLAAAGASGVALALTVRPPRMGARGALRCTVVFALAALAPVVAAWAALARSLTPAEALRAVLGTWAHALDPELSGLSFYRVMRGTDAPLEHLGVALRVTGAYGVALVLLVLAARASGHAAQRAPRVLKRVEPLLLGGAAAAAVAALFLRLPLEPLLRPLPFALVAVVALALREALFGDAEARARGEASFVLAVYGGLMALKLGLRPSVREYGFVLAAPGALLVLATLVQRLPAFAGAHASRARALVLGGVVALVALHMNTTYVWFSRRTLRIAEGGDSFLTQPWRTSELDALLAELDARVPEDGTLLVLPEGVSLNYWLRRRAPIPVYNFMPPELVMYGEDALVRALEASPPDVVVLAHKETPEYGYRFFGQGYGETLTAWLRTHYHAVSRHGAAPLTSKEWGASVYLPNP